MSDVSSDAEHDLENPDEPMAEFEPSSRERVSGPGFGGLLRSLFSRMPWGEPRSREERLNIPAPPGNAISVRNANGKTRVIGEDRDDIEIGVLKSVRADCPNVAAELLDSIRLQSASAADILEIEVQIPRKCARHAIAHIELRVPRETQVSLSSTNGKICLEGLDRAVRARSSNGSIRITEIMGDIDVTTANAKVACRSTHGHLRARSSNGKIEVASHRGSVDASTSNGVIRAVLEDLGHQGVSLKTSNGRIVLELPEKSDADVDIQVENGHIRNDLDLQLDGDVDRSETNGRVRGRLGKGGVPIRLRTSNGTVSLR
ncbi:MAG: DUF4097 domain-containing protein [Myxococcota bacterium]